MSGVRFNQVVELYWWGTPFIVVRLKFYGISCFLCCIVVLSIISEPLLLMPNANVHARLVFFKEVNASMRKFLTHYPKM
jgi:hypothetical protein